MSTAHLRSHVPLRIKSLHPLLMTTSTLFRRLLSTSAVLRQDTLAWSQVPLAGVRPAADSLFHVIVDVSDSPDLTASYTRAGQYLQLRLPGFGRSVLLAIASPPSLSASRGVFEFLVKNIVGSTAEILCGLGQGDVVELSPAIGNGFEIEQISPARDYQSVYLFATGSGISPIRSLIEMGFNADERSDVRLYYGARNYKSMAYQDRFKDWESSGVKIMPVLSQSHDNWTGERGFVQAAFSRAKKNCSPLSTGAVLCGHKQMAEVCQQYYQHCNCSLHPRTLVRKHFRSRNLNFGRLHPITSKHATFCTDNFPSKKIKHYC